VHVLAGQTTPDAEPVYGRGFLTTFADRVRNEARIPTLVGGYLTTIGEVNAMLAAGRADLCLMDPPELDEAADGSMASAQWDDQTTMNGNAPRSGAYIGPERVVRHTRGSKRDGKD
jgi:2,4-dienoyl-CoA reductase-like NADH-dependent reductase (Old Yellow Enzyme family)